MKSISVLVGRPGRGRTGGVLAALRAWMLGLGLATLLGSAPASAQTLLHDDFTGGTLNPAAWSTLLVHGGSSVVQGGGVLTTTARGVLGSVADFEPAYVIAGTFTLLSDLEHFNVVLRSDLGDAAMSGERTGVVVSFSNDGNDISIQQFGVGSNTILTLASYLLTTHEAVDFTITDTGSGISLAINGVPQLFAATSFSTGTKIGFYSREFSSTATAIDQITITAIPEPAVFAWLAGALGLGAVAACRWSGRPRRG